MRIAHLERSPHGFPEDRNIPGGRGPLGWNVAMISRWRVFAEFDVLHVHGGIWRSQIFFPLFKRRYRWKTLAAHFHGSETRSGKGLHHLQSVDVKFRSTPDLASRLPDSIWVPNPIDLPDIPQEPDNPIPRFGHFPTRPDQKGTSQILELFGMVFGPLRETSREGTRILRGPEAELWIVSGRTHNEALRVMANCDAVIDQISSYESYGMVGIEGMAFAKPVFSTLRGGAFVNCPVLPLGAADTVDNLLAVARDRDLRKRLGRDGRAYIDRVHNATHVAELVLRAYYESQRETELTSAQSVSYWKGRGASYAKEIERGASKDSYAAQTREILGLLERLPFRSVLEIGCGYGRIGSSVVGRFGCRWTGLDISRRQLREARRRDDQLSPSLVEASSSTIPFRPGSFELVLAVEVLMHVPPARIRDTLKELLRVSSRHVLHVDWFENYLLGFETGWCWMHDYSRLWAELGVKPAVLRLDTERLQRAFVVSIPPAPGKPNAADADSVASGSRTFSTVTNASRR